MTLVLKVYLQIDFENVFAKWYWYWKCICKNYIENVFSKCYWYWKCICKMILKMYFQNVIDIENEFVNWKEYVMW